MCAWHVSSTPNCVFMVDLLSSSLEFYSNAIRKKNKRSRDSQGWMSLPLAATITHKKFCLIFPSADRFCIFTHGAAGISYDDGVGIFNSSKSNQFLRHPSYQGREKKRMGNYFSTLAIIEKNGREGVRACRKYGSIKHLITFCPKK